MKTIYKYPLVVTEKQTLLLPSGFEITSVGLDPNGYPSLWAIVNPENSEIKQTIYIVGTGQAIPKNVENKYVGKFICGVFVWHVFIE